MKIASTVVVISSFCRMIFAFGMLMLIACEKWDFPPATFFSIELGEIEKYTFSAYRLRSAIEIPEEANAEILQLGHCWSTENQQPDLSDHFSSLVPDRISSPGQTIEDTIRGLALNTTYFVSGYFIADIDGRIDTIYSLEIDLISTEALLITTDENFEFRSDSMTVRGLIRKPDGRTPILQFGHCWSSSPDPFPDPGQNNFSRYGPTLEADVLFESRIKTLELGKQLYIRSYAMIEGLPIMYGNTVLYSGANRWIRLENMPAEPRGWATSFVIEDRAYIGTGHARGLISNNVGTISCYDDFWSYDLRQNEWSYVGAFPGGERAGMISLTTGSKAYLGLGFSCQNSQLGVKLDHFRDFYAFDPGGNGWRRLADYPGTPRSDPAGFAIGDTIYIGTGRVVADPVDSFEVDFWKYSIKEDAWYPMPPLPGPARNGAYSFALNGKGYVGGGDVKGQENIFVYQGTSDIYEYDPLTGQWQRLPFDLPHELTSGSAVALEENKRAYFLSGLISDFKILEKVLEFDPEKGITAIAETGNRNRALGTAFGYEGKLYLSSGTTPQFEGILNGQVAFLNDLWVFNF